MRITKIEIKEYEKNFISHTNLGSEQFFSRFGWYIKIYSDDLYGIGEAAPIPKISVETHEEAGYALNGFKLALEGIDYDIELEELLLLSDVHGFNIGSARFAIESAIYHLFSQSKGQSIAEYLNPNYLSKININAIYNNRSTLKSCDTNILKIKINNFNIFDIKEKLDKIIEKYSHDVKLRLDFNEGLDLPRSIRVCKELQLYNIDYIEQPLHRLSINDFYDLRTAVSIPIAIDESIADYQSVIDIIDKGAADVIIVKPTITGGFKDIKKILDLAKNEEIRLVLTSSFETSIAQDHILNLISALRIKEYCGVYNIKLFTDDTLPLFDKDQIKIPIQIGKI